MCVVTAFTCNPKSFPTACAFLFSLLVSPLDKLIKLFVYFSSISALGTYDLYRTYYYDMPCAFKPRTLEINSISGYARACGILLFSY